MPERPAAYHPAFRASVEVLRDQAARLQEGAIRPEDAWADLMGWLKAFMRRVGRWESYYIVEWEGTPLWLKPDEVPLAEALDLARHVLERMAESARAFSGRSGSLGDPATVADLSDAWCRVLVDLMPWVVWGGPAAPAWYRCIVATYEFDPGLGEGLLRRIYETAQESDDEAIRLLARGGLDFFRLRRAGPIRAEGGSRDA